MMTSEPELTGKEVLGLKMPSNDADAETVREYLKELLSLLWEQGESFSGKRPFGNSGWEYELYGAFELIGITDHKTCNALIFGAIEALTAPETGA